MTGERKRMDVKEFRAMGLLMEVNRRIFHPMGLALEVVTEEDGSERLGGIWDYRDDPVGIIFDPPPEERGRVAYLAEIAKHRDARRAMFGCVIQPTETEGKA